MDEQRIDTKRFNQRTGHKIFIVWFKCPNKRWYNTHSGGLGSGWYKLYVNTKTGLEIKSESI
jgi:hypothetical protein